MPRASEHLERLWPAALALVVVAVLAVGLHVVGRGLNRPPSIGGIEIEPKAVPAGGAARVRVTAEDPDGDRLSFAFRAEHGRVDPAGPSPAREAQYQAADRGPIGDRLTVTVTDARGLASTASVAMTIGEAPAPATPAPTPVSEVSPPPVGPPPTLPPAALTLPPAATATPRPSPRPFNRAPVLVGGGNYFGVEAGAVGLAASGHDPDGDPVTHRWEFGSCVVVEMQTKDTADVKLGPGCESANVSLVWTDSHGAETRVEWNLLRGEQ